MKTQLLSIFFFSSLLTGNQCQDDGGKNVQIQYPCKGNSKIQYRIPKDQPNDKEKNFYLLVDKKLAANTVINISLILPSEHTLENPSSQYTFISEEVIDGIILKDTMQFKRWLKTVNGKTPYVSSLLINYKQECKNPGYDTRDKVVGQAKPPRLPPPPALEDLDCGRPKIISSGFITWGSDTKEGDWPWHVALFQINGQVTKYICGGTLISKSMVLTAAHCVTTDGVQKVTSSLTVVLGKYNLFSTSTGDQEKTVHRIKVHEKFEPTLLQNDIALIQLNSEVVYSNYVQPACLWREGDYAKLANRQIFGTVVGWGLNQDSKLSLTLKKIKIPRIPDVECIKTKPSFFAKTLSIGNNFCAGYRNGTSVCNGDSGGGFMVFVPDNAGDKSENPQGSWHIRGITSLGIVKENTMCDPNEYSLFTDVSAYLKWIRDNMET